MWFLVVAGMLIAQTPAPRTTLSPDLKRAEQHDRQGWLRIDARDFTGAADAFEAALQIHPNYADALYGLGKARMALQQYPASVRALERSHDAYAHAGTESEEYRLLANTARQNQISVLRRRLADLESPAPASSGRGAQPSTSTEVLDLKQQIRTLMAERDPGPLPGKVASVPSFVSLALGSAYFHIERLADAERQFREALAVEPKFGEALSNLALVCLLTGRAEEAQSHVRIAEEARFTVNPELKRRIREALNRQ
jgi:tetratricopeptide (TPR) repeat protein